MRSLRTNVPGGMRFYVICLGIYILTNYCWLFIWQDDLWLRTTGEDIFSALGATIATVCVYRVSRKAKGEEGHFWFLMFLSCLSYIVAEYIWNYYELILGVLVPFPGLPDVFYLLQYVLVILAILYLLYQKKSFFISIRLFLDILITMTVVTTLSWYFFIQPIFLQTDVSFLFQAVMVAYPIADLGLIFGFLSLNATSRTLFSAAYSSMVMRLSLFVTITTDTVFLFLKAQGLYFPGSIIDPLWTLSMLLICLTGLLSVNQSGGPHQEGMHLDRVPLFTAGFLRCIIPYLSLFVILTFMAVKIEKIDSIVLGSIIVIFLIIIRQVLTILENKRLVVLLSQRTQELEISKNALQEKHESLTQISATIKKEARTDFLTGVYNRRYIEERLEILLEQAKQDHMNFSLFMLDIDYFKRINDNLGHEAGDAVLKQISQIMLKNIRSEEIIGRFGGEEFIGFLPGVGVEEAQLIAERLRKQIAEHIFVIGTQKIRVTVSIGVTQWSAKNDDDVQSLMTRIDKALYEAKSKSRNCIVVL